jgi:hypothetical protein
MVALEGPAELSGDEGGQRETQRSEPALSGASQNSPTRSAARSSCGAREGNHRKLFSIAVATGLAVTSILFFVDKNVHAEYQTYTKNKEMADKIRWTHIDDVAVFRFLEEVYGYELNNAVFTFETSQEIVKLLREQLAGLFQTLLQRRARMKYESHVDDLINATKTLSDIVNFLQQEKMSSQGIVREIVFTRHPLFKDQAVLHIDARVFFETLDELQKLLPHFGFGQINDEELARDVTANFVFWTRTSDRQREYIELWRGLFDESGHLRPIGLDEWKDGYLVTSPRVAESRLPPSAATASRAS